MSLLLIIGAALAAPFEHLPPVFTVEVSAADPVTGPEVRLHQGQPLMAGLSLLESDAVVEAYAGIARVTLQQRFLPPTRAHGEAAYFLPLPDGAVVDLAEMRCSDRRVDSVVVPRGDVPQRDGKPLEDFALLDAQPGETFSWRLGALCDGPLDVTVQYTVALPFDGGHFSLALPSPPPPTDPIPWAGLPAAPDLAEDAVTVFADAGMPLHTARSGRHTELDVRLCGGQPVTRRDDGEREGVWLSWALSGAATTHHRPDPDEPGIVALTLSPETLGSLPAPVSRELLFVLDRSCSMEGAPFDLARGAVEVALDDLVPGDTFNLYRLHAARPLFPRAQPLTPETRAAASRWMATGAGEAGGPAAGLRAAMHGEPAEQQRMVTLLTDGHLDGTGLASDLDSAERIRLVAVGLGGYADRALLDTLAARSRGMALYPTPHTPPHRLGQQLSEALAPPTLSAVTIDWSGLRVLDQQPARPLDITPNQPLRVLARYDGSADHVDTIRVHGRLDGAPVVLEVPVDLAATEPHHAGLATAWASQYIDAAARETSNPPQTRAEITDVAVSHGLVTRYTSLVSVDQDSITPVIAARPLPEAVSAPLAALEWVRKPVQIAPPPARPAPEKPAAVVAAAPPPRTYMSTVGMNLPTGEAAERIRVLVDQRQDEVRECYAERLRTRPALEGTVSVNVEVSEGKIVAMSLAENTTGDARLARCAVDRIAQWPYPEAVTGQLHLPFALSTRRR